MSGDTDFVMVPREPTEAMKAVKVRLVGPRNGLVDPDAMDIIYRAMIAAAPNATEGVARCTCAGRFYEGGHQLGCAALATTSETRPALAEERAREILASEWEAEGRKHLADTIRKGSDTEWNKAAVAIRAMLRFAALTNPAPVETHP